MGKIFEALKSVINSIKNNQIFDEKHNHGLILNDKLIGEEFIVKTEYYTITMKIHIPIKYK